MHTAADVGTYATRERTAETELFSVALARHPAGGSLVAHAHARPTATVVLGGDYEERLGSAVRIVEPMALVVKPGGTIHANRFGRRGARSVLIELKQDASVALGPAATLFARARAGDAVPAADTLIRLAGALLRTDPVTAFEVNALVLDWFGAAVNAGGSRAGGSPPAWLKRVRDHLHASGGNPPSLGELARDAGRHPIYVARRFRLHFGESVGSYARRIRIRRTAGAIAVSPSTSIARIAADTGYCDQSHLTHEFRARTGMTPSRWRSVVSA